MIRNLLFLDPQYYDIRKKCEGALCYDFSNMERFLNQKSVRDALGVGEIDFVSCSSEVHEALLMDWMRNLEVGIPALLEDGIKVLVYAGEYDLICNWLGKQPRVNGSWNSYISYTTGPVSSFFLLRLYSLVSFSLGREFKVGSCHGMVWTETVWGIPNRSIFS